MKLKQPLYNDIKNIIFDFGNVILDIDIQRTLAQFQQLGIAGLKIEDIHPHQTGPFLELELGTISDEGFLAALRHTYPDAANFSDAQIWEAWNKLLLSYDPKRIALLHNIKAQYNIYLLSNTNHPHRIFFLEDFRKQFGYELATIFKKCYYSDEMKLRKPDPVIYSTLLEDAGIKASETLFIDDNLCNFSGSEAVGIHGYHLTGGETILDLFE